jgi:hypothetical protein
MRSGRPPLFWKRKFEPQVIITYVRWYLRLSWVSYCDTFREIIAWPRQRRFVQVFVDAIRKPGQGTLVTTTANFARADRRRGRGPRQSA